MSKTLTVLFWALLMATASALGTSRPTEHIRRPRTRQRLGSSSISFKTCYEDVLQLADAVASLAMDMNAVMLSHARFDLVSTTVEHLQCEQAASSFQGTFIKYPRSHTANQLRLSRLNNTQWAAMQQQSCTQNSSIHGLAVVIAREPPLKHFGHRMLTDLPALFALRTYLLDRGVDPSHARVIFTDNMGAPAWGPDNFKRVLHSLGFKSYEPLGHIHASLCFEQLIILPHYFFPKWYTGENGVMANMWKAPAQLYDTDPFHIRMIGHVRAAFGLPSVLPFAPVANRTVVLASRDSDIRRKHGFRLTRLLINEGELLRALQAVPGIHVLQVELGIMPMDEVLRLLERTSLLVGYHGAAFDNLVFLPRGASVLEILPKGTTHAPLYPALAHRTGKEFARHVNSNVSRQTCRKGLAVVENCLSHYADLVVSVDEVVRLARAMLQVQAAAMTRHSFDENV